MVVILGGGITGVSTAYFYLQENPHQCVTIVDAVGPAAAASGKAGAFVTSEWATSNRQGPLFAAAFEVHETLAKDLELKSFQPITAERIVVKDDNADLVGSHTSTILPGNAAMVDPAELTEALFQRSLELGATFRKGTVQGLQLKEENEGKEVEQILFEDGSTINLQDEEDLVVALGPWSSRIEDWLEIPVPIEGVVSTSMIWEDLEQVDMPTNAIFCPEDDNGCHLEIFPRISTNSDGNGIGSLYVSGCGSSEVWSPAIFRQVTHAPHPSAPCSPNPARTQAAQQSLRSHWLAQWISPQSSPNSDEQGSNASSASVFHEPPTILQACIRPTTPDGMPMVGKLALSPSSNVYICSGGGPWGITWGPLMGQCLAQLLLDEDEDFPIRMGPLVPKRFDTLLYRSLMKERRAVHTKDSTLSNPNR